MKYEGTFNNLFYQPNEMFYEWKHFTTSERIELDCVLRREIPYFSVRNIYNSILQTSASLRPLYWAHHAMLTFILIIY